MKTTEAKLKKLITLYNQTFKTLRNTELICCEEDPIYRPADKKHPYHRVIFAHGFFASALHEIAHWCIAGKERRLLEDFGYWYEPDGRTQDQQRLFEKVEVKPQALEWIFSVASHHEFHFSADNLSGDAGVSETFMQNVYLQVQDYLENGMPEDAEIWTQALLKEFQLSAPLTIEAFKKS